MNTTVDGEYQRYATENGAYIREHFFGPDPRLRKMVEHLSDDEIEKHCRRGGHDYQKVYAAYKAATEVTQGSQPTVILAKTIKGWTLGRCFEGRNATHSDQEADEPAADDTARASSHRGRHPGRERSRGRRQSRRTSVPLRTPRSTST